jgi:hypothetical protein
VPDGEQGRSYDIWRCPECLEQVEPPGHGDYAVPTVAGHYHDGDTPDPQPEDWDGPYDRWVPGERIRVCEHPTDGEGADERKWTRAFTRLEKAVQRHRDAKGWTDDADDELHRVLEKVLRDVGPAPARARSDGEQGRSWTLWVCPECSVIEQDEPCMASMTCHREGHGGVPMERVRVYEHTTAEDRNRG